MAHVIYKLTSPSGKVYIGRTNNFEQRMTEHKSEATRDRTHTPIYKSIRKHGWDSFTKDVVATVETEEDAILLERTFIKKYDTVKFGYNCHDATELGGNTWVDKSEEELDAFREKMSDLTVGEMNGMYGKTHRVESIDKMKKKAAGRFSLPWFINRHGEEEGTQKYKDRCKWLSERNMKRNKAGHFTTNSEAS